MKDKTLKPGDYAYHRPTKQYVKLDKLIMNTDDKTANSKPPSLSSWECTVKTGPEFDKDNKPI